MEEAFDAYRSLAAPSEGLFKDNGSRFIALAYPVETEEEVKSIVAGLRTAMRTGLGIRGMSFAPATTESLPAAPDVPFWARSIPPA